MPDKAGKKFSRIIRQGVKMKKIPVEEINYIRTMCNQLIHAIEEYNKEVKEDEFIFASSNRAKFDRLRVELTKEMMKLRKKLYPY